MAPGIDLIFPRRIARVSYALRTLLIFFLGRFLAAQLDNLSATDRGNFTTHEIAAGLILFAYWCVWVVRPRFVDLAMSPWCPLLMLLPGLNLFLAGYLTWGRTKVRADWPRSASAEADNTPAPPAPLAPARFAPAQTAEALRRLESLRADGTLSEEQFLRMKARHGL